MFCTQLRLNDRRYSTTRQSNPLEASRPLTGVVERLCMLRNASDGAAKQCTVRSLQASLSARTAGPKPTLQIFSLRMQPGTKTLAQQDIRRDPRKLPPYCKNFKNSRKAPLASAKSEHVSSDLIVLGVEISQEQRYLPEKKASILEGQDYDDALNIQLTECCQCLHDSSQFLERLAIGTMIERKCVFKVADIGVGESSCNPNNLMACYEMVEKEPSPRTKQVISVTVNSRKTDEQNDLDDED